MLGHKDRKKYDIFDLSAHYYDEYCKRYKNNVYKTK